VCSIFFRFGGGRLHHNVPSLVFRNPLEIPTARFTSSSPSFSLKVLLRAVLLPRRNRYMELSFFRGSCRIPPCSLMPLSHFGFARRLLPNVRPFEIPCAIPLMHGGSSAGGSRLLPGPTIALGPFLWLLASPYG
jgi:hypothetical protein